MDPETSDDSIYYFSRSQLNDIFPFKSEFVKKLFANTYIHFVGDSLLRAQYKDLVALLQRDDLCRQSALKKTSEPTFMGDVQTSQNKLIFNGPLTESSREYSTNVHLVKYKFISRCLNAEMDKLLCSFMHEPPDVLVLNSCLWDVSRYGNASDGCTGPCTNGCRSDDDERSSLQQLSRLMRLLHETLPAKTMVIWVTTPPVRKSSSTSTSQFNDNEFSGRLVMHGNYISAQIVRAAGYDVMDADFILRIPIFNRFQAKDGVHWHPEVVRLISQMLIGHIAKSWRATFDPETSAHISKLNDETECGMKIYGDSLIQETLCPLGNPDAYTKQDEYFTRILNSSEGSRLCDEIGFLRYVQCRQNHLEKIKEEELTGNEVVGVSEAFVNEMAAIVPLEKPERARIADRVVAREEE